MKERECERKTKHSPWYWQLPRVGTFCFFFSCTVWEDLLIQQRNNSILRALSYLHVTYQLENTRGGGFIWAHALVICLTQIGLKVKIRPSCNLYLNVSTVAVVSWIGISLHFRHKYGIKMGRPVDGMSRGRQTHNLKCHAVGITLSPALLALWGNTHTHTHPTMRRQYTQSMRGD